MLNKTVLLNSRLHAASKELDLFILHYCEMVGAHPIFREKQLEGIDKEFNSSYVCNYSFKYNSTYFSVDIWSS